MIDIIRKRPWLLVVLLLGLFVLINGIMLYVAQSSHGPDLLDRPAPQQQR